MPRRITIDDEWVTFVPSFDGIRRGHDAGLDDEPVCMEIRPMTAADVTEETLARVRSQQAQVLDGDAQDGIARNALQSRVAKCVRNVRNYSVRLDGTDPRLEQLNGTRPEPGPDGKVTIEITTADELHLFGEVDIYAEVQEAVTNYSRLQVGARKQLGSQS